MSLYVHVSNADLIGNIEYLAGLSYDKTDTGNTVVNVVHNYNQAVGSLLSSGEVVFRPEYTNEMMLICQKVGIPFNYC